MFLADRASNSIDRWVNFDRAWPLAGSDGLVSRLRVTEGTEEKKGQKGKQAREIPCLILSAVQYRTDTYQTSVQQGDRAMW